MRQKAGTAVAED